MAQVENDLRGRFQPHHVIKHSLEGIEEKEEDEKCSWRREGDSKARIIRPQ